MSSTRVKGRQAEVLVAKLWPGLKLTSGGGWENRAGIDGYLGDAPVQIKFDERIAVSGNIYHEIWEKSIGHPEQEWRHSPSRATVYFFVTDGFILLVRINALAIAECDLPLRQISETSMGFLVPLCQLGGTCERKEIGAD